MSLAERVTGLSWADNGPVALMGFGHAATHWITATFIFLLPAISSDFGLSYTQAGALVSVLHLASFGANFASGPVVDISGRKVLFQVIALATGAAAMATLGTVSDYVLIAALVAVMGITANLWHPPAISFLSSRFPAQRGYALSIHGVGASLGDAAAPLAAGAMLAGLTWRETTTVTILPVVVVAGAIAFLLLPGEKAARATATKRGMSPAEYLSGMGRLLRDRAVLGLCLMSGFRSMTQNGLITFLPLYLADVAKVGPWLAGVTLFALQAGGVLATPVAGAWSDRVGRRPVVLAGLTASTVIIASLTFLGSEIAFVAGVSLLGFALFAVRPVVHSWMMDITPADLGGSSTSVLFATQSGLSILIPLIGGIVADTWGLTAVFYVLAGTMLITNLLTLRLPAERRDMA